MGEPGPVFVCGADRAGPGLLGEMLELHPELSFTRRTDFFTYYHRRFGTLSDPQNLGRLLATLARDRRYQVFVPDLDEARSLFLAGEPSYTRLFGMLQEHRMHRTGKTRWGDKSLWSERHADLILRAYPAAQVVHVVRDPRDQFASFKFHRRAGSSPASVGAAMWRQTMRFAERNLARHPARYSVVRYEDLVADPEGELRRMCDFLSLPFASEMLSDPDGPGVPGAGPRHFHTSSVGRYERDLTSREVGVLELVNRPTMRRFGYAPVAGRSAIQRAATTARLGPTTLVQMWAWRARSGLRRLRGLAPPESRLEND